MKKAVVVLSIAFILLLLVSGIASAGFWQDITGKVSLFLFRKELQAIEPPTAYAHPTEPAELVHLLDIGNVSSIVLHPTMQNIIYAEITPLMHSPSLYRSADSGRTWQLIGDYRNVAVNKIQPNRVYASRGNKIYESLDYGLTFSERDTLPLSGSSWEYYITTIFTDRFDWEKVWIGTRNEQYGVFLLDLSQPRAEFKPFNLDVPLSCSETLRNRLIWAINQDPANRNILYFLSEDADHDFYEGFNVMRDACPGMISPHQYSIIRTINEGNTFQTFSGNAGWHYQNIFPIIGHGETKWYFAIEGDAIFLSNGSEVMQWQLISSTPRLGNEAYYEPTRGYNVITDYINNPINLSQHFISTYAIDFLTREIISGAIWQFNPKNNQWNNIISIPGTIISSINIDNCVDNIYFSSFTGGVYVIRNINNGDIIDKPFGEACSIGEICSKETLCINWSATIGNYRCARLRDEGCNYERVCLGARCKIPTGGECDIREIKFMYKRKLC